MDPNKIVRDQWLDDQDLSPYGMSGQKGYVHVVVYANGRKTIDAYKYGREGESQDPFKSVETVDQDVKKDFDNPPPTRNIGGQVMQFNPETGQYDKPLGAATQSSRTPEKAARDAQDERERVANQQETGYGETNIERREREQKESAAAEAKRKADAQTAETARHNQVSESDQATRTWLEQQKFQAGSTHTIGDRIYRIRPDGKAEDITPPGSSLKIPTFDPGTHVGIIQEAVAAKLKEIESNPQMTTQEKLKAAELITANGKLLHDETVTVLSNQNTIRGQDITQRGQDMVQTAQRATLGNDIYTNAYKNSAAAAQYMPAGSDPGMGMIGQMLLNAGSIGAMGGSANAPQVPQGQAQQQLMGMGLPGMPSININLGGLTLPNNPTAQNVLDAAGKPGSPAPLAPTTETPPGTFPDQPVPEFANSLLGQT